jgi:energy-coupling factor transport system ATP-binding protein
MIEISGLSYWYPNGDVPVLREVDWQVGAGEFVLVVGESGAGKSTLLRCLNGLVPHFSGGRIMGSVQVGGLDVLSATPSELSQMVGFVFQGPEAQGVLDRVEAEIAFGMENLGLPEAKMQTRMEEILGLLDLTHLRGRLVHTLSGGERQRVALAAVLVLRPQVLVLDEPTSQLDPIAAEKLLDLLVDLRERLGLTVILAEHRLERVLAFVDRVVVVAGGQIVADGAGEASLREVVERLDSVPPVVGLKRILEWDKLALSVEEARGLMEEQKPSPPTPLPSIAEGRGGQFSRSDRPVSFRERAGVREILLDVKDLVAGYDGKRVLNGVNLQVASGEIVALLGRNGAGKSTLLRCVVGLMAQDEGEVWLNGAEVSGWSVGKRCRHLAYLPQNPDDLLFADTVRQELDITLRNHKINQNDLLLSPDDLLEALGLRGEGASYPRDLSVGQRQRVAFGAVAVVAPQLLILDEPTRGLDMPAKKQLMSICQKWVAQGAGLLLVSHDVELVAEVADRVFVMEGGKIVGEGESGVVMPAFPEFTPQIAKIFPGTGWLTLDDVIKGIGI